MPNPFLKLGAGAKTSTEPPQRVEPVPEEYEGDNFPYRGTQTHGVDPTHKPEAERDWEGVQAGVYRTPEPDPDPVPVRIVQTGARELHKWVVSRSVVNNLARQIVGRNEQRTAVRVRNLGAVTVWVGPEATTAVFTGYPIPANTEFVLAKAETPIYAVSDDGTDVAVAVLQEYSVAQ